MRKKERLEAENMVRELRRTLSPFHFEWLCALAVFPGLRWPLTQSIGAALAARHKAPRGVMFDDYLPIVWLDWLREGVMGDELRLALLAQARADTLEIARETINSFLNAAAARSGSSAPEGRAREIALTGAPPPGAAPPAGLMERLALRRDVIFLQTMSGARPDALAYEIDERLARRLGLGRGWLKPGVLGRLGLWSALALLAAAGVLAAGERVFPPVAQRGTPRVEMSPTQVAMLRDCADCPEMIVVEPPAPQEGEAGTVKRFALARLETTRADWERFVGGLGASFPSSPCFIFEKGKFSYGAGRDWRDPGFAQSPQDPVVCVSKQDVERYIGWLNGRFPQAGYRLPTSEEWRIAARAGSDRRVYWGDGARGESQCDYANGATSFDSPRTGVTLGVAACNDGFANTAPVGSYLPNALGFHDMLGNVAEWTSTCYDPSGGSGCDFYRTFGGGWNAVAVAPGAPETLSHANPGVGYSTVGFRLARSLQ